MPDFPDTGLWYPTSGSILSAGQASLAWDAAQIARPSGSAAGTWPANNRAFYIPFLVDRHVTIARMIVEVTTQSGNLDLGIYDENFALLVSLGSTAVAAAGIQIADITDTTLTPGMYYMAMNCSTTAAAFMRQSYGSAVYQIINGHCSQDVGATALPSTATPAAYASPYVPCIALMLKSTG